jgi:acyl-CoA oxidase
MQKGMKLKNSWDEFSGLELVDAATAHGYNLIVKYYWQRIEALCKDAKLKEVLTTLFRLYAIDKISDYSLSFYEAGVLGSTSLKTYRSIREQLLAKIRPNALALVESFSYSDSNLHSAIGRADGKAYETLYDWAKNKNDVNDPKFSEDIRAKAIQLLSETSSRMKARL